MDIAQTAIGPPPSVKRAIVEKSVQNHPYTILTPPGNVGKKCPKPFWQALRAKPIWKQHISKRGLPNQMDITWHQLNITWDLSRQCLGTT